METLYKKYILDIETKPQEDLKEIYPKKDISKMAIDTDYADIVCIGLKELGKEPQLINDNQLEELFKKRAVFITYNGKGFDIPLIIRYGIKKDLDLPYKELRDMTKRFQTEWHIDLMEILCDYGKWKSLDELLQIYLGISKKPIDFETATEEEIKEHCLDDLYQTEMLYNKFNKLI